MAEPAVASAPRQARTSRLSTEMCLYLVGPVTALITTPVIARALGPEDRGRYGLIMAGVSLALSFSYFGQAEVLLGRAKSGSWPFRHARAVVACTATIATLTCLFLLWPVASPYVVVIAVLPLPLLAFSNLWRARAITLQRTFAVAAVQGVAGIARFSLILTALAFERLDLAVVLIAAQWTTAVAAVVLTNRRSQRAESPRDTSREGSGLGSAVAGGAAIVAVDILLAVGVSGPPFVLAAFSDLDNVGTYTACASLAAALMVVSGVMKNRVQASLFSESGRFRREMVTLGVLVGVIASGGIIGGGVAADLMFGSEFDEAGTVLRILVIATCLQMLQDVAMGVLIVFGHRRLMISIALFSALCMGSLMIWLVPMYGAVGASISLMVAVALSASFAVLKSLSVERRSKYASIDD